MARRPDSLAGCRPHPLAVIVENATYEDVVRPGMDDLKSARYRMVEVSNKT